MNLSQIKTCLFLLFFLLYPVVSFSQESIRTTFSEETNKTTVILTGIKLPANKDNFSVGALFEYNGKELDKEPCCVVLFMTSTNKKSFQYEKNHNLTIWADNEKLEFGKINWREANWATAFVIAEIAYPEEMFVGMEKAKFNKIANGKAVKVQIGKFKFQLTSEQLKGFQDLIKKMQVSNQ